MSQQSFGKEVIFLSLYHCIAPALDLTPCLQAQGTRDYIKCAWELHSRVSPVDICPIISSS